MEEWRDIKGYEHLYQASSLGNIRSVDRVVIAKSRWGNERKMVFKGKSIVQFIGNNGYYKVTLSKNGNTNSKDVHRLVYEAFYGEIPNNLQVNHKDECKLNNKVENLELLTPKENTNYGTHNERMRNTKRKKPQ